jgi:hypothetical protein
MKAKKKELVVKTPKVRADSLSLLVLLTYQKGSGRGHHPDAKDFASG